MAVIGVYQYHCHCHCHRIDCLNLNSSTRTWKSFVKFGNTFACRKGIIVVAGNDVHAHRFSPYGRNEIIHRPPFFLAATHRYQIAQHEDSRHRFFQQTIEQYAGGFPVVFFFHPQRLYTLRRLCVGNHSNALRRRVTTKQPAVTSNRRRLNSFFWYNGQKICSIFYHLYVITGFYIFLPCQIETEAGSAGEQPGRDKFDLREVDFRVVHRAILFY